MTKKSLPVPSHQVHSVDLVTKSLDTFFELAQKTIIPDDFLTNREQLPLNSKVIKDTN